MKKLSASLEDYIEAIAELISVDGHAHTKAIAEKLKVKMPSVTNALQQLSNFNYIVYTSNVPVELTESGKLLAQKIIYRHKNLEQFFNEILGLPFDKAKSVACEIEHHVDDEIIDRLVIFSKAITTREDSKNLQVYLTEAITNNFQENGEFLRTLTELNVGEKAELVKYSRNFKAEKELNIGTQLHIEAISLDKKLFQIKANDKILSIHRKDGENIWVKVPECHT